LDQDDDGDHQDDDDDNQGGAHQESVNEIGRELEESSQGGESFNDEQSSDDSMVVEQQTPDDIQPGETEGVDDEEGEQEDGYTEFDCFKDAEAQGRDDAAIPNAPRPKCQTRSTKRDDYVYSSLAVLLDQVMDRQCFISSQLSAKAGLKMFGPEGATAIMKELGQLILMDVIKGCFAHQMSCEQKQKA
jgi:hypothetical protein